MLEEALKSCYPPSSPKQASDLTTLILQNRTDKNLGGRWANNFWSNPSVSFAVHTDATANSGGSRW
eukprot:785834-Amphidinium_carterae.1